MLGNCHPRGSFACAFLLLIPLSALAFVGVVAYISSLSHSLDDANGSAAATDGVEAVVDVAFIDQQTAYLRCLREGLGDGSDASDCESAEADEPEPRDEHSGKGVIYAIFSLQWVCLNAQLALFTLAFGRTRELHVAYAHLSDWAVNSGPMLGVLGTIVSFAFLLGESGADGLAALFNARFFDAATTTIMGGCVYLVCLFLTIWIGPAVRH